MSEYPVTEVETDAIPVAGMRELRKARAALSAALQVAQANGAPSVAIDNLIYDLDQLLAAQAYYGATTNR